MNALLDRVIAAAGVRDIVDILANRLSPTDLQSLMLEVYRRRSGARTPADLLADYGRSRFFGASSLRSADTAAWDQIARESAVPGCEFLLLSPMTPLGTCAAIASVGQAWSVPTARTGEVVSDPTNVLALEAATRRREATRLNVKTQDIVHLASTHRVVRPQAYANPKMLAHFSLFGFVSAGRDRGGFGFEREAIRAQVGAYLIAYRRYFGSSFMLRISYTIKSVGNTDARLEALKSLAEIHNVEIVEDPARSAVSTYYNRFCFHILGRWPDSNFSQLADGGMVDWGAKLLGNAKERMLISGTGVEGLVALRMSSVVAK
jgi:hypothetical protein